jgi:hypothetical protein
MQMFSELLKFTMVFLAGNFVKRNGRIFYSFIRVRSGYGKPKSCSSETGTENSSSSIIYSRNNFHDIEP